MKSIISIIVAFLVLCNGALADESAYANRLLLEEKSSDLIVIHEHDWSRHGPARLFGDLNRHEKFFGKENDFSYIKVVDRKTKLVLFKKPTSAFTHVAISPNGDLIVGLSNIMLYNPYQIVVFSRNGEVLLKYHISSSEAVFDGGIIDDYWAKYSKAKEYLKARTIMYDKKYYVDCFILGVPNKIEEGAFNECIERMAPAHWSPNYSSTVTNRVFWFDDINPSIQFERTSYSNTNIMIADPKGQPVIFKVNTGGI